MPKVVIKKHFERNSSESKVVKKVLRNTRAEEKMLCDPQITWLHTEQVLFWLPC